MKTVVYLLAETEERFWHEHVNCDALRVKVLQKKPKKCGLVLAENEEGFCNEHLGWEIQGKSRARRNRVAESDLGSVEKARKSLKLSV